MMAVMAMMMMMMIVVNDNDDDDYDDDDDENSYNNFNKTQLTFFITYNHRRVSVFMKWTYTLMMI